MIDVASHPCRPQVLLQSLSAELGLHALVYDGETILWGHSPLDPSPVRLEGWDSRIGASFFGLESENLCHPRPVWMGPECSGPFTSLAVLDDHTFLMVGRRKSGNTRAEVLILVQRVRTGWKFWPLLAEGVEKEGIVLRCFRSVWGAAGVVKPDGVLQNSCWIWGLCSSTSGWQDRQWKLSWDLSVRPVQVKVELTDLHSGGFSIPAELKSFSFEQLDRRSLLQTGVQ